MIEADLARWTEDVLISLIRVKNDAGLKVMLTPDDKIKVLASVITTINNTRADTELFKPLVIKNFGLPPDA